jgi:hypothetical protein
MAASLDFYKDLEKSKSVQVRRHFIKAYKDIWPKAQIMYVETNSNDCGVDCTVKIGNRKATIQEKVLYGALDYDSYFFETTSHNGPGWLFNDDIFNSLYLFLCRMSPDFTKSRINIYPLHKAFVDYCREYSIFAKTIVNSTKTGSGFMLPYEVIKKWEVKEFYYENNNG